ncbi:MAG: hypothetical protein H0U27_06200, partial [Nitrosopumilus sp.]|nr:hypothetical protein [Nitrosopumilus sp.]
MKVLQSLQTQTIQNVVNCQIYNTEQSKFNKLFDAIFSKISSSYRETKEICYKAKNANHDMMIQENGGERAYQSLRIELDRKIGNQEKLVEIYRDDWEKANKEVDPTLQAHKTMARIANRDKVEPKIRETNMLWRPELHQHQMMARLANRNYKVLIGDKEKTGLFQNHADRIYRLRSFVDTASPELANKVMAELANRDQVLFSNKEQTGLFQNHADRIYRLRSFV